MRAIGTAILAAALALPVAARAQDSTPQPEKYQNVTWYMVVNVAFKPGKKDDALGILRKYYFPAARSAGVPTPMVLDDQTGPWDLTLLWTMKDGPAGMAWKRSPDDVAWMKAMNQMVGSGAKADSIGSRFNSYVDRGDSRIAFEEDGFASGGK